MTELWYFSSPTCQPCKALKPTVEAFGVRAGLPVQTIDCTDERNTALIEQEQVRMVPTIVVRHKEVTVSKMVGPGQWAPDKVLAILKGLAL